MCGHGVVNRYIGMVNSLVLLHRLGNIASIGNTSSYYILSILYIASSLTLLHYNHSFSYGFVTEKLVCLGFISLPRSGYKRETNIVTTDFIMDPTIRYEIDIAGTKFPAKPHIHPLPIPISSKLNKKYIPTPVISYQSDVSR